MIPRLALQRVGGRLASTCNAARHYATSSASGRTCLTLEKVLTPSR
jgi:hypothetical protein